MTRNTMRITRYKPVYPGYCSEDPNGQCVLVADVTRMLDYIVDNDDRDEMLAKITQLREELREEVKA